MIGVGLSLITNFEGNKYNLLSCYGAFGYGAWETLAGIVAHICLEWEEKHSYTEVQVTPAVDMKVTPHHPHRNS